MVWGAIAGGLAAGAASSILGGNKVNDASKDAIRLQQQQYNQTRQDLAPWQTTGGNALNAYSNALGLGGSYQNQPMSIDNWNQLNPPQSNQVNRRPAPGTNGNWSQTQDMMNARNKSQAAPTGGYQNYLSNFDRGEWIPSGERQDSPMYDPFSPPPGSQLPTYTPGADLAQYGATAGASPYTAQGYVPGYTPTQQSPEYQSQGQFNFNLENDPIYQFQQQEGLQAAERKLNAMDMGNSGNILDALQKRGIGIAGQYQNEAFGRQLAGSQENYGRGVQDYSIADARGADNYNRNVQDYNIEAGRGRELYNRGAQDYGINFDVNRDAYNRGTTDYGINANTNNTMFNRGISNYGIGTDRANTEYGRGQNEWNLNQLGMNTDAYGREQNYLNRLAQLSGSGQNAAAQLGGFGASSAANMGSLGMQGGVAQANQYQGVNNAIQGSIGNYLTHDLYSNNPYLGYGGPTGGNSINGMINTVGR